MLHEFGTAWLFVPISTADRRAVGLPAKAPTSQLHSRGRLSLSMPQRELAKGWRVPATVFYDRPPDFFRPATLEVCCCCLPLLIDR